MFLFEFTETIITESAHSNLYHVTDVAGATSILANKEFELGFSLAKDFAEPFRPKGSEKYFYLSTARSPTSSFISVRRHSSNPHVLFELNGDWFNKNGYVTKPVDYFNGATDVSDEMEDRVFSKEPTIKFGESPHSLIKAIHLMIPRMSDDVAQEILPLVKQAKKDGVPLFAYANPNAWLTRRTEKAIPSATLVQMMKDELADRGNSFFKKDPSVFNQKYNPTGLQQFSKLDGKRAYKALMNLISAKSPDDIQEETYHIVDQVISSIGDSGIRNLFMKARRATGTKGAANLVAAIKKSGLGPDKVWDKLYNKWMGLSYGLKFKNPPKKPKYDAGENPDMPF